MKASLFGGGVSSDSTGAWSSFVTNVLIEIRSAVGECNLSCAGGDVVVSSLKKAGIPTEEGSSQLPKRCFSRPTAM